MNEIIKWIQKITSHNNVIIASRGNEAIKFALENIKIILGKGSIEKKIILIPDQGGWLSYKKIPIELGFEIRELKTDKGVIILDELEKSLDNVAAFLFTSFAGYYAEQPLEEISKICRGKNVFVIEDASGSFGDKKLCNGKLSDFIVSSFGEGKVVNYGKYGFVSTNLTLQCDELKEVEDGLKEKVLMAPQRLKKLLRLSKKVKEELKDFNIFHREKKGVNVITEFDERIIDYCKRKNYESVICPKYYKVNEKAISIELKRLDL